MRSRWASTPAISRFFGIVVYMHHRDHPPPHVHAVYAEFEVVVELESGTCRGEFPRKKLRLLQRWIQINRDALLENSRRARERKPLRAVTPLGGRDGL